MVGFLETALNRPVPAGQVNSLSTGAGVDNGFDGTFLDGILAADTGIKAADDNHVGVDIAGRHHGWAKSADFAPVIEIPQRYGHTGTIGNVVETRFPMKHFAAGTRRRDHQDGLRYASDMRHAASAGTLSLPSVWLSSTVSNRR